MKRRPTEWEKIFAIDASNKDLITKIYEQLIQLNNNNKNQKVGRRPKDIQMAKWHMTRCSALPVIRGM